MSETLQVDYLTFELQRSANRKTVGITIERDGRLVLTAPVECPLAEIERIARGKRFWVYSKLAEREEVSRPATAKEFVSGEGFYYLGRSYRLLLVDLSLDDLPALRLAQGRWLLRRDERHRGQKHFINWYTKHGQPWLQDRVNLFVDRIGVEPRVVEVRDLGFRWGSCGKGSTLYFHWRIMLLPPGIIEYIIVHELVHLLEPHHTQEFWQRIDRAMPDFAARKQWLAENGGRF